MLGGLSDTDEARRNGTTGGSNPRISMPAGGHATRAGLKGFAWLFGMAFVLWLALTSSLSAPEVIVGCAVSLAVSILGMRIYSKLDLPPFSIRRILFSVVYVIVLFWEIIRANVDVAYRVIHPRMPIRPGIVVIRTSLRSNIAKLILANSITLTPGTFTLDVVGDRLLIHWIDVKATDLDGATRLVGQRFERYLKPIFG
jgi:multicomponent Na+:H+ antiporter subunit E